jgi:hypothetical protein
MYNSVNKRDLPVKKSATSLFQAILTAPKKVQLEGRKDNTMVRALMFTV